MFFIQHNFLLQESTNLSYDTISLKKALEWELSLDSRDLRSHAWYHGAIPRLRAEEIIREDSQFLVRDCTSQPGNYVLTCRTKNQILHFVINKVILHQDTVYERTQYQFEDEAFDTIPDLITSYVGSGKPITISSEARILYPKNRMYPLSFYATKYLPTYTSESMQFLSGSHCKINSFHAKKDSLPKLPEKKNRSQSLTPSDTGKMSNEKCFSADGIIQPILCVRSIKNTSNNFSSQSLPRISSKISLSSTHSLLGNYKLTQGDNEHSCIDKCLTEDINNEMLPQSPPPKPSRVYSDQSVNQNADGFFPFHGNLDRAYSYRASGSDSGNGSGDSAISCVTGEFIEISQKPSGVIIKNPHYILSNSDSTTTLKNFESSYLELEEKLVADFNTEISFSSSFDLENFETILLPATENKPLDSQALKGIKLILKEYAAKILANHVTKIDLDLIYSKKELISNLNFQNSMDLYTLVQGKALRMDLIERYNCKTILNFFL